MWVWHTMQVECLNLTGFACRMKPGRWVKSDIRDWWIWSATAVRVMSDYLLRNTCPMTLFLDIYFTVGALSCSASVFFLFSFHLSCISQILHRRRSIIPIFTVELKSAILSFRLSVKMVKVCWFLKMHRGKAANAMDNEVASCFVHCPCLRSLRQPQSSSVSRSQRLSCPIRSGIALLCSSFELKLGMSLPVPIKSRQSCYTEHPHQIR